MWALGQVVKVASLDQQVWSDAETVQPTRAIQNENLITGVISEDWVGFDGNAGRATATVANTFTSGSLGARSTQSLKITVWGYHPAVLIDNTGAGAVATVNGTPLHSSANAAGKCQGVAAAAAGAYFGFATLPAAGLGSSLGAGAVVAASQSLTVTGVPAVNDVLTATFQVPFAGTPNNQINPGIAVTRSVSTAPLTAAQAASVTTAATALAAALNADSVYAKYYTATSALGVVTHTLLAGNQFFITTANQNYFYLTTSGTFGNNLSIAASATGGSILTAGGATLAGGTGYVGTIPTFITVL